MTDREYAIKELGAIDAIAVLMGNVIGEFTDAISDSISTLLHGYDAPAAEATTNNDEQAKLIRRLQEEIANLNNENAKVIGELHTRDDLIKLQEITIKQIRENSADQIRDLEEDLHRAGEREAALMVKIADLEEEIKQLRSDAPKPKGEPAASVKSGESDETKDGKKTRSFKGRHDWTTAEDEWIRQHLNSATSREVAERFGVSEKAAYARMCAVRDNASGNRQ